MPKKITRRSFLKRTFGSIIAIFGLGGGTYYYSKEIETKLTDVTYHEIINPAIPTSFNDFKIVQFSDTHLGFQYNSQQLKKLVERINRLNPDVIFFTGDLMDAPNEYDEENIIIPILKELKAPFGKFAIYGNHDHGGYGTDIYKSIMQKTDFQLLLNSHHKINLVDESSIYIIGVDDAMLGKPDILSAVHGIPDDSYKILLSHAPDFADEASAYNVQLQLSGHTHGGQVQVPLVGALVKPPFGEKYHEGFYQIGQTTLYVNRGLGTTRLPFRFLSKPELTVFTLKSLKKEK
ncbi:putative MPP superfamily phosphohydrolase [Cytobacillus eiseniae]|uniref:MPP superfamily phosphohydrolase n=1 Tax=Cytobacillus eiseniae TaxID=762947 RepID=A0ABS4RAL9_9BACI|nr:metallophosphoesterase [Cytobacillus eiseniae]MBP2239943.1 putative MPP superfamily phosphohydrolase [Cytobacillus eiseniae]